MLLFIKSLALRLELIGFFRGYIVRLGTYYLPPFPGSSPWYSQPLFIDNAAILRRSTKEGKSALQKSPKGVELPLFQKCK